MRVRCLVDKGWPLFNPRTPDVAPVIMVHEVKEIDELLDVVAPKDEEGTRDKTKVLDFTSAVEEAISSGLLQEVLQEKKKEVKQPEKGEEG